MYTDFFVVRVDSPKLSSEILEEKMELAVSGNIVLITELESVTDWVSVKKVCYLYFSKIIIPFSFLRYHKVNNEVAVKKAASDPL